MKRFLALSASLLLAGCAYSDPPRNLSPLPPEASASVPTAAPASSPPAGQQYLYGSAEGAVMTTQVFAAMADFVETRVRAKPVDSVVIMPKLGFGAGGQPPFVPCDDKPFAAVFDADETLIWNLGVMRYFAEQGTAFDPVVWDRWEKTGAGKAVAVPGAKDALRRMRAAGVTIIINTNRSAANAAVTEATLRAAGLGDFKHGETLFLMGDAPDGSGKDGRRTLIAQKYCVVAMAGDQLGDFFDWFNDKSLASWSRKGRATGFNIAPYWGHGWFLLPNPVYGPAIKGSYDDIFPAQSRWSPSPSNDEESKP